MKKYLTKDELHKVGIKYFVIRNRGCNEFKEYINWLNKEFNCNYGSSVIGLDYNMFYGFDDNKIHQSGTNECNDMYWFENNPTKYKAKEFMDLITIIKS